MKLFGYELAVNKVSELKPESKPAANEGTRTQARATWQSPYLSTLRQVGVVPVYDLYKTLREAIPCLDTAINKLVLLLGNPEIVADEPLKGEIETWMRAVRVNQLQVGFSSFVSNHVDSLIWSGKAVGEIVPTNAGRDIYALVNIEPDTITYKGTENPLDLTICQTQTGKPLGVELDPDWLIVNLYNPGTDPHGTSLFRSLPFVGEILLGMEQSLKLSWERFGTPSFQVSWEPPEDFNDSDGSKTAVIMKAVETSFIDAMKARKVGDVKDFFASGKIVVKAIGSDGQVLEFATPYRTIMEQIAGRTGLPPWMLGFSWSTTERLSTQQADVLIATLDGIWDELYPDLYHIIELRQQMAGRVGEFELIRQATTLQDAVETARAEMMAAQAEKVREASATRLWEAGIYTQEQYGGHILGDRFDGQIAVPMDLPPAPAPSAIGGIGFKAEDARTSIGQGEQPKDPRVKAVIAALHGDMNEALEDLRRRIWYIFGLSGEPGFAAGEPFRYSKEQTEILDRAIEEFLTRLAGADRTKAGWSAEETGDGIMQQWERFAHGLGIKRASEMTGMETVILPDRGGPAIRNLLDRAFDRLSDQGQIRLEGRLGDIRTILQDGMTLGQNPIEVSRTLAERFDQYKKWEFERLARTEVAFAQNDGLMDEFRAEGVDLSGVEQDPPPWHPNCMCSISIEEVNGRWQGVYDIAITACDLCQAYAGG